MFEILTTIWDVFNIGGNAILAGPLAIAAIATAAATTVSAGANIAQAVEQKNAQEEATAQQGRAAGAPGSVAGGQNPIADPTKNVLAQLQQLAQSGNIPTPRV